MSKTALITGINGQDGSYLAELLLNKGYDVYGLIRRQSVPNTKNIDHLLNNIHLLDGDMTDQGSLVRALQISKPDEVYNLAAQTFVGSSFNQPVLTAEVNAMGCLNMLESIRQVSRGSKFYQAGTSEMFGNAPAFQNEKTQFQPRSPYGVSKVFAHYATVNYRESYGMFAANGILFNHESERRGSEFVTKKVAEGVAKIYCGDSNYKISLGNIDAVRDWGYAPEYVDAMWRILNHDEPDDFVISTGYANSIKDLIKMAFKQININNWNDYVVINSSFNRPADVNLLCGDSSKAKNILKWEANVRFEELVKKMVHAEIKKLQGE